MTAPPTTPAASEGPYRNEWTPTPSSKIYSLTHAVTRQILLQTFDANLAANVCNAANSAHRAALASREVRELVEAANEADLAYADTASGNTTSPVMHRLRAALAGLKGEA